MKQDAKLLAREIKQYGEAVSRYGSEKDDRNIIYFHPTLVSADIRKETEVLTYPVKSLVAEIGGTLGLFLGFSFMMVLDWIEAAAICIFSIQNTT